MSIKTIIKHLVINSTRLLSAATLAHPLELKPEPTSANCRGSLYVLEVAKLTNQVRAKYRLHPLRFNCKLYSAAQDHTFNMVRMRNTSHIGSDGSNVARRVQRVGYQYSAVAENVAHNQKNPSQVVEAWMSCPRNRHNILDSKYTEIGVGYSNNYWTQIFGRSK